MGASGLVAGSDCGVGWGADSSADGGVGWGADCGADCGVDVVDSVGGGPSSGTSGDLAAGCGAPAAADPAACAGGACPDSVGVAPAAASRRSRSLAVALSDGLAIAAAAVPCGEAGVSAGANGPSDWLQEAAARPSAAQMSGRNILIMGALQICGLQAAFPSSPFGSP